MVRPDQTRSAGIGDADPDRTRLASATDISNAVTRARTGTGAGHSGVGGPLGIGQNFGSRYHVIRLLGVGGMGAVYQAWDQVLEVAVAIKVIRIDPSADPAAAADLEKRFKRELLLARQVTHKNVVRIHDLGEIDGIKYITMPYIQGADLWSILKSEGRLPVARALDIAKQVASGLVAAHDAGVVHRDLKPANIMLDAEGHACVMDFGIARSTTGAGFTMTVAGAVVGTLEYMAPEQAKGETVDQRADVYALGLILRDMLLGPRHFGAGTAMSDLMLRMQQQPTSLRDTDPQIPAALDEIVVRCLQPDPAARFETTKVLLVELERLTPDGHASVARRPVRRLMRRPTVLAAALVLVVLAGAGVWIYQKQSRPAQTAALSGQPVSLAVVPFRNTTEDASLDSLGASLSEVLATDLGESSQIRTIPPARLHQVLGDLRIAPNANHSPSELKRIADLAGARVILWGQYSKFGDEIRIDGTLQNLEQNTTTRVQATAANTGALLAAVAQLAESVQHLLAAGSAEVLTELKATAWRPTTQSFEALRLYNEGLQLSRDGNHQNALKRFEASTQEDPNFALAFSALAQTHSNLGYATQATQQSRRALSMSEALPPQEKYLIAATHYRITNDLEKGIETYEKLLKISPNNAQIHFELASLFEQNGDLAKAAEHYAKAVELDPKHVEGLLAVGRVHIKRGDPQASIQPLSSALSLSMELNNDEARANILQALGIAYKRRGRPADALKQYRESLEIKRRLGNKRGMAVSLQEIAQVQELDGKPQDAVKSYQEALQLQREIGDKSGMSITMINLASLMNDSLGRPDDAMTLLTESLGILRELGNASGEALALNNVGAVYLSKGQYSEAQTNFERALELRERTKVPRDIADTLHNLGETHNKMGRYDPALKRYLKALELRREDGDKRNAAIESYSIGTIFDYQGRYGAAVKSKAEALQEFRELKQRDFWFGEILSGHGYSLALTGRLDEASKSLDEALAVARELKNQSLVAQSLRFQAERLYYAGDIKGAARLAEQAAQAASRGSDRSLDLWAQFEVAKISAAGSSTKGIAATLAQIGRQAEIGGLTYLSVNCALESAETLLRAGDHQQARQEAERTLARAETLGLRELVARSEYVLASAMRLANDRQARRHYTTALQLLEQMKREDGNQKLLERADLKTIHAESERWSKAS